MHLFLYEWIVFYKLLQPKTMIKDIAKFLITNPLLYIWIVLLVSLYKTRGNRRRLILINIMFYCLCTDFSGSTLSSLWKVDDRYDKDIIYDAAIILTGTIDQETSESIGSDDYGLGLSKVSERLVAGTGFVKSGHAELLLFGNFTTSNYDEGPAIREYAKYQGLNEDEIKIYGDIRSTVDEAHGVKRFLDVHKHTNVVLITSEMHMRRALALFNRAGVFPDSYSVDRNPYRVCWKDFIPTFDGPQRVQGFLYELLGYVVCYLKGDV